MKRQPFDLRKAHKLAYITLTEAVDCLLAVAHHKRLTALRQTVVEQRYKIVPLQDRGILELINQEMPVAIAETLVDKWSRFFTDDIINQPIELG